MEKKKLGVIISLTLISVVVIFSAWFFLLNQKGETQYEEKYTGGDLNMMPRQEEMPEESRNHQLL